MSIESACRDVLSAFLASPTSEPLVVEQVGERVVFSRGVPSPYLSISEAASFFGVSRSTFYRKYINTKLLRVTDQGISRRSIMEYLSR